MVFLGDNQNSVCILSAPEVVGICLRSIVALGSLSLPTPSSSASSHNCVGSCRYSATNNLNILFNFSTVGKWTVLRLSPLLCHCLGNGVAITCRIGTPKDKITMLFEAFDRHFIRNNDTTYGCIRVSFTYPFSQKVCGHLRHQCVWIDHHWLQIFVCFLFLEALSLIHI